MKWGYVIYYFSHHYINYCILCNEKAEKKPSRVVATLCGCDTQKSIVDSVQLLPFHPGWQWECDTQNQFLSTVPSTMPTVTNTTALLCLGADHEAPWRWTEITKISSPPWAEVDLQDVVGWMCDQASQVLEYARTFWCMSADKFF